VIDRVLAVVGSQVVTLSDARAVVEFGLVTPRPGVEATADAVDYLVNRQLMLSEVDRYSAPSPAAGILAKRMAAIRSRFPSDAAYQQALARTALTDGRLRDFVGDNIRIESYLDQRFNAAAQPTPDEVQRYYVDHPAEFARNGRVPPLEEVQAEAFAKVTAERRNFLIAEWLDRVRRRFAVSNLYTPVVK
jgi:peptidyl-prolyl cis-trans isomerase C